MADKRRRSVVMLCLAGWLSATWPGALVVAANPARYVARFTNGVIVEENTLSDWHAPGSVPKLGSQPLLEGGNPIRWLVDRSQSGPQPLPEAFLELVTGDCLPGIVYDYRSGTESPYGLLPPHFLVRYDGPSPVSWEPQTTTVRVVHSFVRRVVWSRRPEEQTQPYTAYLRDGRFLRFRSIRWSAGEVSLLLESGPQRIPFAELAEVVLPPPDYWKTYFDELAWLAPDGATRLLQTESSTGLIVTTSVDRLQPRVIGDARDVSRWLLGVQPAWSLDPVWLWQGTVRARRLFTPAEILLSRVSPIRATQEVPFGEPADPFRVDRNIRGGPLRSASREAGWGLGVQAFSELEFELPASARAFRAEFALDGAMRGGGCVQPRVLQASPPNSVLYQGPVLIGSQTVVETGTLPLTGPAGSPRRIVLQVDPVVAQRPPQADPFHLRDQANWLEPLVELDLSVVQQELAQRMVPQTLAWDGWKVEFEPGARAQRTPFLADSGDQRGSYQLAVDVMGGGLRLTRTAPASDPPRWLVVDAVRTQPAGPPCKLAVRIGEGMPVEWDVPVYDKSQIDQRPLIVALGGPDGTAAPAGAVEIRQLPATDRVPVWWRGITFTHQHPLYYRLFDDALAPPTRRSDTLIQPGNGELDDQQKHSGSHALRIPVPGNCRLQLTDPIGIRERPQLGEYRFLRFAVRKQGGGGLRVAVEHRASAERPAHYTAGMVSEPPGKRLTDQPLPDSWQIVTRDLYGDFGSLDLTGLTFQFPDGETGWLDHVYLARKQSDFDLIPPALAR